MAIDGTLVPKTLVASATQSASGNSGAITFADGKFDDIIIELNCTAKTGTSPTLDVYVQQTLDGTNYADVYHFTQLTNTTTSPVRIFLTRGNFGNTSKDGASAVGDATVSAATFGIPLLSNKGRIKWVIGGSAGPSFTFSVMSYADEI
jgi:hypothetical protein